jgi:inhibitor of growth protein 4
VYDAVDAHIRALDEDLRAVEAEMAADRARLGLPPDASAAEYMGGGPRRSGRGAEADGAARKDKTRKGGAGGGGGGHGHHAKPGRKSGGGGGHGGGHLAAPAMPAMPPAVADATEPRYCTCHQVSYGEMIACENPDCPIEWYHIGCVGIPEGQLPKGKWYCPKCAAGRAAAAAP